MPPSKAALDTACCRVSAALLLPPQGRPPCRLDAYGRRFLSSAHTVLLLPPRKRLWILRAAAFSAALLLPAEAPRHAAWMHMDAAFCRAPGSALTSSKAALDTACRRILCSSTFAHRVAPPCRLDASRRRFSSNSRFCSCPLESGSEYCMPPHSLQLYFCAPCSPAMLLGCK